MTQLAALLKARPKEPAGASLRPLVKEFTQSASPTSGLTAYGNTGKKRRRVRLRPASVKKLADLGALLKYSPDQPRDERGRFGSGGASAPSAEHGANAAAGASEATGQHLGALNPDHLERLDAANAAKLESMYKAAAEAKPAFDKTLTGIAQDLGGQAQLPGLKGSDRATEKIVNELAGNASGLRDVLRATIEVKTAADAQKALAAVREKFDVQPGMRNTLTPDAKPPDGYRDIKMNVQLNGLAAEIQINLPSMLAAKNENHALYEQRRTIDGNVEREQRAYTSEERAAVAKLDAQMKSAYDKAWGEALRAS